MLRKIISKLRATFAPSAKAKPELKGGHPAYDVKPRPAHSHSRSDKPAHDRGPKPDFKPAQAKPKSQGPSSSPARPARDAHDGGPRRNGPRQGHRSAAPALCRA